MSSIAPHQALYRRWRAQTFAQIVGQQPVVETLRNAVRSGRTAHAYLFVGPRGTGKTSMARILAKALNCTDLRDGEPCDACPSCIAIREGRALDVSEMDAASNNRVDDIRELLPRIYTAPSDLRRKVFIVDEVQRIREGWDVLLKTLEEPPEHVVFVFCTTDSSAIRPAVVSRVQRFDFRKLTVAEIAGKLRAILAADGREADPEAIDLIARLAAGGMRDAESMLDQLLSQGGGKLAADTVRDVLGLVEEEVVEGFLDALVGGDAIRGIELLDGLEERGRDLRAFTEQATERLRTELVHSLGRGPKTGLAAQPTAALAAAARSLASIDPAHAGPGGLRLQLELALLQPVTPLVISPAVAAAASPGPAPRPADTERPVERRPPDTGRGRSEAPLPSPAAMPKPGSTDREPEPQPHTAPPKRREPTEPAQPTATAPQPPPTAPSADAVPPAAASPPAAPPRRDASGASLQLLLDRWPEVVAAISKDPPTKPLIEACRPVAVDGAIVTLGFPESRSFFKDVAERRRRVLEEGVGRVLGTAVTVRCVATNVEVAAVADDDTSRLLTEFRRIYGDDAVDVRDVG